MFGKIISIANNNVLIENLLNRVESTLVGVHIIFENDKTKVVGQITNMDTKVINSILIGEFVQENFVSGIINRPSSQSKIRIINKDEVVKLLGVQQVDNISSLYIGKSLIYHGYNVSANINDLFSNHFAIIGNTGSGKSCSVARIFQNLFYRKENVPYNSKFVLFDVYGEYHVALDRINKTKYCRCKTYTSDVNLSRDDIIKIPPWFLGVDDIALLLNADSMTQLPLIEKALKLVYLFTEEEEKVINHKNNIIAKAIRDVLTSGKSPTQIRDQVIAVLSSFNTKDINLESQIVQPGYVRTLKQCMNIDQTGKINTMQLVIEFLEKYINEELVIDKNMKPKFYQLKDLYNAFEFALLSEGVLKSDKVYDTNNILKVRLDSIINGDYGVYFDVSDYITLNDYINNLFINIRGEKTQIINFNLNYVDERFTKILTKIFSKMFFDYSIKNKDKKEAIQIVLEEAHRYVQNDNDINVIGYNIFDRITKEGRKYGVLLGLVTQRPSELSITALSQCSNYIVLRMFYPEDLKIIKSITHDVDDTDVEKLKALRSGVAFCFGSAFKIPVFVKIDLPDPPPSSENARIDRTWFDLPKVPNQDKISLEENNILNSEDILH